MTKTAVVLLEPQGLCGEIYAAAFSSKGRTTYKVLPAVLHVRLERAQQGSVGGKAMKGGDKSRYSMRHAWRNTTNRIILLKPDFRLVLEESFLSDRD